MKKRLTHNCLSHELETQYSCINYKSIRTATAIHCPFFAQNGFDPRPQVTCPFLLYKVQNPKSIKTVDPLKFSYFK